MQRLILTILAFISLVTSPFAGDKGPRTFTDEDLKKYKSPSYTKPSADSRSINHDARAAESVRDDEPEQEEPKRHIIPYKVTEGMEMSIIIPVTFNNEITDNMLLDTGASGMHISYRVLSVVPEALRIKHVERCRCS